MNQKIKSDQKNRQTYEGVTSRQGFVQRKKIQGLVPYFHISGKPGLVFSSTYIFTSQLTVEFQKEKINSISFYSTFA